MGYTAAATGPLSAKITLVNVLQVSRAVDDFRDRMSSQRCSSVTEIFILGIIAEVDCEGSRDNGALSGYLKTDPL